jgi:hypothetical protein
MQSPGSGNGGGSRQTSRDLDDTESAGEFETLASELSRAAAPFIGTGRVLENFGEHKVLADATSKFVIRDHVGHPEFVVLCSAAGGPGMVARGAERARDMVGTLGDDLGRAVLLPVWEGDIDGRTFAVFPYYAPLKGSGPSWWVQRSVIRPRLVQWLLDSSRKTVSPVPRDELERRVYQPLEAMIADDGYSLELRALADEALCAARAGDWQPKHVFMHDDLWVGNVLIDQRSPGGPMFGQFVIIDWAGSRVRGYPLYDFLRLSISFRLAGGPFFRALDQYCAALGYTRAQASYAFAGAVADLGQRLEEWPRHSYLSTIERCYRKLDDGS